MVRIPSGTGPPSQIRILLCFGGIRLRVKGGLPRRSSGKHCPERSLAFPTIPSWNQIAEFLKTMKQLRDSTGFAA